MLARTSTLQHPRGMAVNTPLLLPSFSSKGYGFANGVSEVDDAVEACSGWLTEPMLMSAYDLYYKHIPFFWRLQVSPPLVFVDSGGYETSLEYELSATYKSPQSPKKWSEEMLNSVLKSWPAQIPGVFVNFDSTRRKLPKQISAARDFFRQYPEQLHDIILKPEKGDYLDIESVLDNIADLDSFHIIGMTEKELAGTMLERLENIARVRQALDKAGIRSPLHIFGGLDPLSSSLYFIAGAEIFDGLTWLRYSYLRGMAVYKHNFAAISIGLEPDNDFIKVQSMVWNMQCMQQLRTEMKGYAQTEDFTCFRDNGEIIERAYRSLASKLGGEA